MTVKLRVEPFQGNTYEFTFDGHELLIGRSSEADLCIKDQALSRRHARLYFEDHHLYLADLESHNGTRVDGRTLLAPKQLTEGSSIEMGESRVVVLTAPAETDGSGVARYRETTDGRGRTLYVDAASLLAENNSEQLDAGDSGSIRFIERLRLINAVHAVLSKAIDIQSLLEGLIDWFFEHLHPDEAAVFIADERGKLEPRIARSRLGPQKDVLYSSHLAKEVVEKGNVALVYDAELDERFTSAESIISSGVRSLIAAPLLAEKGCLGMIALNARGMSRHFSEEDMEVLVSIASVVALRLQNLALAEEAAERRRLQEELALARKIQIALLPTELPRIPGYTLFGENKPSLGVSGDYYQVVERAEAEEYVFMIVDVSGKGVAASLLTASLEALAAAPIEDGQSPDAICRRLSRLLSTRTPPEKYATLFMASLAVASGKLTYTNAGHCPALLIRGDGSTEWLENTGIPIGLFKRGEFKARETELAPDDLMILYTDGFTEARDPGGNEYEMERLARVCRENRHLEPAELAAALREDLDNFTDHEPNQDDQTLIILRRDKTA